MTMGKVETIKQDNLKYLAVYVSVHVLVFAGFFVSNLFDAKSIEKLSKLDYAKVSGVLFIAVVVVLLTNLASSAAKERIVFWKSKNPLPSTRFVSLMKKDARIDFQKIVQSFDGKLPSSAKDQGSGWYTLYGRHKGDPSVHAVNSQYLLLRDSAWLTLVLLVFGLIGAWFVDGALSTAINYTVILLVVFVLLCVATQNAGERLVLTVLACESAKTDTKPAGSGAAK